MSYIPSRNKDGAYNKANIKSEKEQGIIACLDYLINEGIENISENIICELCGFENERNTIEKIKAEIMQEFTKELIEHLDCEADMNNCSFIDNQPDEDE